MSPQRAPKPCLRPGCPNTTRGRYCDECSTEHERQRGSAAARGYGRRWRKLRKMILARDPVCTICEAAPSTQVDHIIPKVKGGTDDPTNLRGTCRSCNAKKAATEDRR